MCPQPPSGKHFQAAQRRRAFRPPPSALPGPQGPPSLPREQFTPHYWPSTHCMLGFLKPHCGLVREFGPRRVSRSPVRKFGESLVLSAKAQWLPTPWNTQRIGEDETSDFHVTGKCPGVAPRCRPRRLWAHPMRPRHSQDHGTRCPHPSLAQTVPPPLTGLHCAK